MYSTPTSHSSTILFSQKTELEWLSVTCSKDTDKDSLSDQSWVKLFLALFLRSLWPWACIHLFWVLHYPVLARIITKFRKNPSPLVSDHPGLCSARIWSSQNIPLPLMFPRNFYPQDSTLLLDPRFTLVYAVFRTEPSSILKSLLLLRQPWIRFIFITLT